jgi:hypothetical protein
MKVGSVRVASTPDGVSVDPFSMLTGKASASFALLLGMDGARQDENPHANVRTDSKFDEDSDQPLRKGRLRKTDSFDVRGGMKSNVIWQSASTPLVNGPLLCHTVDLSVADQAEVTGVQFLAVSDDPSDAQTPQASRPPRQDGPQAGEAMVGSPHGTARNAVDASGTVATVIAVDQTGGTTVQATTVGEDLQFEGTLGASAVARDASAANSNASPSAQVPVLGAVPIVDKPQAKTETLVNAARFRAQSASLLDPSPEETQKSVGLIGPGGLKESPAASSIRTAGDGGTTLPVTEKDRGTTAVENTSAGLPMQAVKKELPLDISQNTGASPTTATINDQTAGNGAGQSHRQPSGGADNSSQVHPVPSEVSTSRNGITIGDLMIGSQTRATALSSGAARNEGTPTEALALPAMHAVAAHLTETGAARALQSAMRADLHVGVQTEAFGRVTIQTTTEGGHLSAQLSLEDAKGSAALAAHLPGVEQKLSQQFGVSTSVNLVGSADRGYGGAASSSGERSSQQQGHHPGGSGTTARKLCPDSSDLLSTVSDGSRYSGPSSLARLDILV